MKRIIGTILLVSNLALSAAWAGDAAPSPVTQQLEQGLQQDMDTALDIESAPASDMPAHEDAAEGKKGGLPQFAVETFPSQIFWLLISFGLVYFLMSRLALPQIKAVVELRHNSVRDDLNTASSLRDEAEHIKLAYEKSRADAQAAAKAKLDSTARAIADRIQHQLVASQQKADQQLAAAEARISHAKSQGLATVSLVASEVVGDIVRQVGGIEVSRDEVMTAIENTVRNPRQAA